MSPLHLLLQGRKLKCTRHRPGPVLEDRGVNCSVLVSQNSESRILAYWHLKHVKASFMQFSRWRTLLSTSLLSSVSLLTESGVFTWLWFCERVRLAFLLLFLGFQPLLEARQAAPG